MLNKLRLALIIALVANLLISSVSFAADMHVASNEVTVNEIINNMHYLSSTEAQELWAQVGDQKLDISFVSNDGLFKPHAIHQVSNAELIENQGMPQLNPGVLNYLRLTDENFSYANNGDVLLNHHNSYVNISTQKQFSFQSDQSESTILLVQAADKRFVFVKSAVALEKIVNGIRMDLSQIMRMFTFQDRPAIIDQSCSSGDMLAQIQGEISTYLAGYGAPKNESFPRYLEKFELMGILAEDSNEKQNTDEQTEGFEINLAADIASVSAASMTTKEIDVDQQEKSTDKEQQTNETQYQQVRYGQENRFTLMDRGPTKHLFNILMCTVESTFDSLHQTKEVNEKQYRLHNQWRL